MKGAILGDIIGSVWEFENNKEYSFELFYKDSTYTDDTVLTIATMDALLHKKDYAKIYAKYARKYPDTNWGSNFRIWFEKPKKERLPYDSFGNGSAMRISPIGWYFNSLEDTLLEAKRSAEVTHNHLEGIKGAQAVASAIYLARNGSTKKAIKKYIEDTFEYDLSRTYKKIHSYYFFNETCQGSVPESIICFLESTNFEDSIRKVIALGGDADTQACITGSISEAFYKGVPEELWNNAVEYLPKEFIKVINKFTNKIE